MPYPTCWDVQTFLFVAMTFKMKWILQQSNNRILPESPPCALCYVDDWGTP